MAEWKKLVVSGSNITQLINDAGYVTSGEISGSTNSYASASINGTILTAGLEDSLTFASGSGQGLRLTGTSAPDTVTFDLIAIPNASLANSTISGVALGSNLAALTAGGGLTSTGTYTGATARTFSVDSGSLATYFNTSNWSGISGDVLINGSGVATIQANSVALGTDTTGDYVDNLGAGTGVTIGSNTGEGSSPTIAVNYGSAANTAVEGDTTATVAVTANELTLDAGVSSQALGGGPSWTLGLADSIAGSRTFQNDVTITGDLVVNGTTVTVNADNLNVEDKYVLLNSGSAVVGDSGLVFGG